jgi:N-acyl-D-amino-acid deacylase
MPGLQILIAGGTVADGTGSKARVADILIEEETIVAVEAANVISSDGRRIIDATGLTVAPGFIDVHSHSDSSPLHKPGDTWKIMQGVTTEIVGNCGFSLAPTDGTKEMESYLAQCFPKISMPWRSFDQFLEVIDASGMITNYVPLVGEGNLRLAVHGADSSPLTEHESKLMRDLVREACDAGYFGFSTGLSYAPGMFGSAAQIRSMVESLPDNAIYATHMRREGRLIRDGIHEAVAAIKDTGRVLQISHLKLVDKQSWGTAGEILDIIDGYREQGEQIGHDAYPYDTSSMMLSSVLPPWALEGGTEPMLGRLADRGLRNQMEREVEEPDTNPLNAGWDSYIVTTGYKGIRLASTKSGKYDGLTIHDLSSRLGLSPFDALARVVLEEHNVANMIAGLISTDDLTTILSHDQTMIGTDGAPPGFGNSPHPRVAGSFARFLGRYAREEGLATLEDAVRRISALPADTFGLWDRGYVLPGKKADLVMFDAETIGDNATYDQPTLPPTGVDKVFVNGRLVVDDHTWTGARSGQRLVRQ